MPTLDVPVFMPRGPVPRNKVLQTALAAARDTLPPTLTCDAQITAGERRPEDHEQPGTDYTVTITYTERAIGNAAVIPAGAYGVADGDDDDDRDGVDKALDATGEETVEALKAAGAAPQGV